MKRNHREREDERSSEPDMIDGHMMWVLLQHLRRSARSRVSGLNAAGTSVLPGGWFGTTRSLPRQDSQYKWCLLFFHWILGCQWDTMT